MSFGRHGLTFGASQQIASLAVLPIENISGDPSQEYFADGMTDALITELSRISALQVNSRTSVMQYKAVRKPLPVIARELNVDAVIEGSVIRSGNRVRISAKLVGASADRLLWAETYDRDLRDVLTLQREVAGAVADRVHANLTSRERTHLARVGPVNPDAYEAYLKGRYHWNKRTGQDLATAIGYFQHAIEIDAGYAPAYVGLADSFLLLPDIGDARPRDAIPKAKAAATKAVAIDETLAEGHYSLGYIKALGDFDWPGAEQAFRRAIELDPRSPTAHHWYGHYFLRLGRFDEATVELERARELDPLSLPINTSVGTALLWRRLYEPAIRQYRKVLEMDRDFVQAHGYLGDAYLLGGAYDQAVAEFKKAVELSGGRARYVAGLGCAYAAAGQRGRARELLSQLKVQSQRKYVSCYEVALLHAALGETDPAFSWLERAYRRARHEAVGAQAGTAVRPSALRQSLPGPAAAAESRPMSSRACRRRRGRRHEKIAEPTRHAVPPIATTPVPVVPTEDPAGPAHAAIGASVLPRRVAVGLLRRHELAGRRRIERPTDRGRRGRPIGVCVARGIGASLSSGRCRRHR